MDRIGPGTVLRITDHSTDPRGLLRDLAEPLRSLQDSQQLPVVAVRRSWRHGSHVEVLMRPLPGRQVETAALEELAGTLATRRPGRPPETAAYVARAGQLARWENVLGDVLPLHPHGHVRVEPRTEDPAVPAALTTARDLIGDRFRDPVLASCGAGGVPLQVARMLGVVARSHPRGAATGTLAFRSHVEGVSSTTGRHTDLRAAFASRFADDAAVFTAALTDPITDPLLLSWQAALCYAWGISEAVCAQDLVNDRVLAAVNAGVQFPMGPPVRSEFIAEYLLNRAAGRQSFRQIAYRVVLNTVYAALTCFGISPMQRYYLCFGLSEAADRLTGRSSVERMREQRSLAVSAGR